MLSSRVIWAIHVLILLDKFAVKTARAVKPNAGMVLSTESSMQKSVLRSVLKVLVANGYIKRMSAYNSYQLSVDISQVTVYMLVQLFHGGICIGEVYDHCHTVGKENFATPEYREFLHFEDDLQQSISERLRSVCLTDFKSKNTINYSQNFES